MGRKIARDAFEVYFGMGTERSYQAVADHYNVTKRAVTKMARKESWSQRLKDIEQEARERTDQKMVETAEERNDRHLRMVKVIQVKALEALKSMSLNTAMDAVRALDLGIKQERLILGDPTDRNAVSVEEVIKREYEEWMKAGGEDGDQGNGAA